MNARKSIERSTEPNIHVKPVRATLDLPAIVHNQFKVWCNSTAFELGKSRVTAQEVLRTLIERLLNDKDFADSIKQDLRNLQSNSEE